MPFQVRVAVPDDVPGMHRIRGLVRENRLSDPARVTPDHYHQIMGRGGRGWVAVDDGRMLGFAVADADRGNVWALFVDPEAEGRGVGRSLHDTMMSWLFATGLERVWLGTDPGTRAAAFYEAAGWTHVSDESNGELRYEMSRDAWARRGGSARERTLGSERAGQPDPTAGVEIRDYRPADLADCLAVFDSNVPQHFVADEREPFRQFLDALPGPYLVLTDRTGAVIGCGGYAFVPEERRADLCWGMVRRELQGRGIGRLLTRARLERAVADPDLRVVALNTSQHTRGFYETLGFRTIEVIRDGFAPGLDRCEMRMDVG